MGWTEYAATKFYSNGQINRKAECDAYFEEGLNRGHYVVVKSTMVGSIYYGAIMPLTQVRKLSDGSIATDVNGNYIYDQLPEVDRCVFGVVVRTFVDGDSFGYKIISETMGPNYYDCPMRILKLLTHTDNEYALNWREECRKRAMGPSLSALPVGTEIEFMWNGKMIRLRKSPPRYQFKKDFWINDADHTYFSKKRIPKSFSIIT